MHRRLRLLPALAALGLLALPAMPAAARRPASNPPVSYFQLPVSIAGRPAFFEQLAEGGICNAANGYCHATSTRAVMNCGGDNAPIPCVYYGYGATPAIGEAGAAGVYEVTIYAGAAVARQQNRQARDLAAHVTMDERIAPLVPIAHPVDPATEWLRAIAVPNGPSTALCLVTGGARYGAITVGATIHSPHSRTRRGIAPCSAAEGWALRVLRALYLRAASAHADGPPVRRSAAAA